MFTNLPTLTEEKFTGYIASNYTGAYLIQQAFTTGDYQLPMVMIKAGKFKELEPGMDVYQGELALSIFTQIDDTSAPMETHKQTVAEVYDLMRGTDSLYSSVNSATGAFHLHQIYNEGFDQEKIDRSLVSILEYKVTAQTLAF